MPILGAPSGIAVAVRKWSQNIETMIPLRHNRRREHNKLKVSDIAPSAIGEPDDQTNYWTV